MPVFAGRLVDAITRGQIDFEAAKSGALFAFGAILALGVVQITCRHFGLWAIVSLSRSTAHMARDAFHLIQRFSTDWHANSFAGSTVRKITRGMWAVDLLNDTILLAMLPSLVVLTGSAILFGLHWPALGIAVGIAAVAFAALTITLSTQYVAPAARLSNAWDTRVGG